MQKSNSSGTDAVPAKSRRVRTGCLTCRERHLKCDEATPDCLNCRKSNRECKRGVRLNFIDLQCKTPPCIPPTEEWSVQFQDESRLIASEYRGGLGRYAPFDPPTTTARRREPDALAALRRPSVVTNLDPQFAGSHSPSSIHTPQSIYFSDRGQLSADPFVDPMCSRKNSDSFLVFPGSSQSTSFSSMLQDSFGSVKDDLSRTPSQQAFRGGDASTAASVAGLTGEDTGMMTPISEKSGERDYLSSPEELRYMQVFVNEVGVWMDSLDHEKHFSRIVPYYALKSPMLLNALLACGVKHLALTQQSSDDKALSYYDTATTQLLRCLQNPERDTVECAVTAVVLNVYEIMSEKPTQRQSHSHTVGARALIRECGWNAKSTGLGAACFWLNVELELLSCLAFNWPTSWEPDQWGLDVDFASVKEHGAEESWVHMIFYIVAKVASFRANTPSPKDASPQDEQVRLQTRYVEWKRLKNMCDEWDRACPRTMRPYAYVYPLQQQQQQHSATKSLFPNVWLIERAASIGRLYYHTAQCLLAGMDPNLTRGSEEARTKQQHHAHQVCGIVAHTYDRGVASVSIRSLAIVSETLTNLQEQQEVVSIFERIDHDTCWKLDGIVDGLKRLWGWKPDTPCLSMPTTQPSTPTRQQPPQQLASQKQQHQQTLSQQQQHQQQQQQQLHQHFTQQVHHILASQAPSLHQRQSMPAPQPMRVNPLSYADFSLPNHPYQNWYEPPSRPNAYVSQSFF